MLFDKKKAGIRPAKTFKKDTLNLCVREKNGLSARGLALFFALLFIVLAAAGFLGAYLPYTALREKERRLEAENAAVQELKDYVSDGELADVREEYRRYVMENFPETADLDAAFGLLGDAVFGKGKVERASLSGNVLSLTVTGVAAADVETLLSDVCGSGAAESVAVTGTELGATGTTLSLVIYLKTEADHE